MVTTAPLDERSLHLRRLVMRGLVGGNRGHVGSSMSPIEILRVLYDDVLRYRPREPNWSGRDRFILSKGHGCLALYAILADKGFFDPSHLDKFCHVDGILGGHPEHGKVPGVEASTGALGHGFPIGVGMALSAGWVAAAKTVATSPTPAMGALDGDRLGVHCYIKRTLEGAPREQRHHQKQRAAC